MVPGTDPPPRESPTAPTALSDPRELTRVLLDEMTEGVSLCSEDGWIVYTNPAEDRMFGFAEGELVGRHVSVQNAYPSGENDRVVRAVMAELKRSGLWQGEWRNRRKDGSEFVSRARISAVDIEDRRHWLCVREDVTGEAAAVAALEESRARLEIATAAAEVGIWDWDVPSGRMTYSERARAISGLPPDGDITIEEVRATVHPEDLPHTSAQAQRALDPAVRDRSPYVYRLVHPDGSVHWCLARGEAIFATEDGVERAVRYIGTIQDITARRRLEQAERDASDRLRLAIDAGRMAVWELDLTTDSLTGSPELNRLLGFPEDAPLDIEGVRARYYPGERERMGSLGRDALARGDRFLELEFRFCLPRGDLRWLLLRAELSYDAAGKPLKAIGVLVDITDRKTAEEDLRSSETRLQLASRAAGVGVWDWNLLTGEMDWSPEEFALIGVDPATPPGELGAAWRRALHPDDRERTLALQQRAEEEGGTRSFDYRAVLPNGDLRWIRSHVTAIAGPNGRTERLVGIESDRTAEQQETEALRARTRTLAHEVEDRQRELDRFYELSNDLFAVADYKGYLRTINPAWSRTLGYGTDALLATPLAAFVHPDDRAAAAAVVARLRTGESVHGFEDRLVRADGSIVWMAWAAVPHGELFYAVGRDISREREREDILRQSQKMEAIGQLTGGIAHDFNNLLQAVQGSLGLIRRKAGEPERVARLADLGLEAASRGAKLTGQLLAFSRAQRLEVRPLAIGSVIDGFEELLRRSVGPMIALELDPPPAALGVLADKVQLEMAALNVVINARDAMPEGGTIRIAVGTATVTADPEMDDGDYVLLRVSDTGPGMEPAVAERAFEPFFTTKGTGKGTGLGLSQVYAMARQSGGTARLESAPGRGTAVSIFLRRVAPPSAPAADPAAPGFAGAAPRATVLVVDDDAEVRQWLAEALEALGYGVLAAEDGKAGLAALASEPDLLLLDYAMPGMTGAEVARAARAARPDLPIVFATGYADSTAIQRVLGMDACILRKPFELAELEAALRATSLAARTRAAPAADRPG